MADRPPTTTTPATTAADTAPTQATAGTSGVPGPRAAVGTSSAAVRPPQAPGRHPGMPPVVANLQQQRQLQETSVINVTATGGQLPVEITQAALQQMRLVMVAPGVFHQVAAVPAEPAQQAPPAAQPATAAAQLPPAPAPPAPAPAQLAPAAPAQQPPAAPVQQPPADLRRAYVPPPRPEYAPPFQASPLRPGFEGMPPLPQFGGKTINA